MAVDEELLARARRNDREAIAAIFVENYPAISRLALGLSGRADVGRGVVRYLIKQAFRALPNWKDDDAPQRWFLHHTILTVRRAQKHQPDRSNDTLIDDPRTAPPEYVAFIRALRSLPIQQREAFILHHGERLNERWTAVTMDCSVIAASNHLNAANASLGAIAGDQFKPFCEELSRLYHRLGPDEQLILPKLRGTIARHVWPRRIVRLLGWLLMLALLAAIAYAAWKIWPRLEF
jgi:DNA-directed RNA polymerase specialized sigma24 family protein